MAEKKAILAVIRMQHFQGHKILGAQWPTFITALRKRLQKNGVEERACNADFLVFSFNHPVTALTSVIEAIGVVKHLVNWQPSYGKTPLQIVYHLQKKTLSPLPDDISPEYWDRLQPEAVYVNRELKQQWAKLMIGYDNMPRGFYEIDTMLYKLKIDDFSGMRPAPLLEYRNLPLDGAYGECFYCGMTTHTPVACPSKMLPMDVQAIDEVGYLDLKRLSGLYREMFANIQGFSRKVADGLERSKTKQDQGLLLFAAFFDVNIIYQLRFFRHLAFAVTPRWESRPYIMKQKIDSHNLNIAIDCLRVGRNDQARSMFEDETTRAEGKPFCGVVGLAFLALEDNNMRAMGSYLERALNMAELENEQIYARLLLARFYDLKGDLWSADNTLNGVFPLNRDCVEARYAKIRMTIHSGAGERVLSPLMKLVESAREYFMAVLIDPVFLPIQGLVDDLLISEMQARTRAAKENLDLARTELKNLADWLAESDPVLAEHRSSLANLEKQYDRGSYYDMIDCAARALALYYSSRRHKESLRNSLKARMAMVASLFKKYSKFWQDFSYRELFGHDFEASKEKVASKIDDVEQMVVGNKGEDYQKALTKLTGVEEGLTALRKIHRKMIWLQNSLDILKLFGVKLLITEVLLMTACFAFLPVFLMQLPDNSMGGASDFLSDPNHQERIFWGAVLLVGPLLALILTFLSFMKKSR